MNQINVAFLSGLFPRELRNDIIRNSKSNVQFAADALQWSLIRGLIPYFPTLQVFNTPFVGSYPLLYRKIKVRGLNFGKEEGFKGVNNPLLNIIGLKRRFIYHRTIKNLSDWAKNVKGEKYVLIYHPFKPYLSAAIKIKERHPDFHICLIVPDLPEYTGAKKGIFSVLSKFVNTGLADTYSKIDSFVLLSKHMVDRLPVGNKKWTVVEGIYDVNEELKLDNLQRSDDKDTRSIVYTGTLHEKYGILNLVEAFKLLKVKNTELVICGDGDAKEKIIAAGEEDKRIKYKGIVDRDEALKYQRQATLLVNPRNNSGGEFTRYSFPSKTMEYLASGSPALLYRLPGIPEEYFDHCFSLDDSSVQTLSRKIDEILALPRAQLVNTGLKAREFILNKKNPVNQCSKIADMLMKDLE